VKQKVSRRDFLKFFGLGTAGTALLSGAGAVPALASTSPDKLPTFEMGPLKISKAKETASVCAFCGVGCGLIVYSDEKGERVLHIEGDPDNPNNEGSMCSKGIALGDANTIVDKKTQKGSERSQDYGRALPRARERQVGKERLGLGPERNCQESKRNTRRNL